MQGYNMRYLERKWKFLIKCRRFVGRRANACPNQSARLVSIGCQRRLYSRPSPPDTLSTRGRNAHRLPTDPKWRGLMRHATRILLLTLALSLFSAVAYAGDIPVGFVSYDFIGGGLAQFDIANQTGPNSSIFPDQTWPVSNSISLGSLSLTVFYTGGGQFTYGSGYFTLEPDGLSWAGPQVPDSTLFSSATLTGTFNPTLFDLNDGSHFNANVNFTATISEIGRAH